MTVRVGYTQHQARRLKAALDGDMARAERALAQMRVRVPDTDEGMAYELGRLHEVLERLKATVDRRTRKVGQ
jgi:hypothetical protein